MPKSLPWDALATHGVLTRTVRDAWSMLRAVAGADPRDPVTTHTQPLCEPPWDASSLAGLRVAASTDLGIAPVARSVRERIEVAFESVCAVAPRVVRAHPDCSGAQEAFETLRAALLFHEFGKRLDAPGWDPSSTVRWNVERGRGLTAEALLAAESVRGRVYARFLEFFEHHDLLLTAAASVLPFPCGQEDVLEIDGRALRHVIDYLSVTYVISLVGLPCLSIPCGYSRDGLPVGLQIVAPPRGEGRLLAFADLLEREAGFRHRFPPPAARGGESAAAPVR